MKTIKPKLFPCLLALLLCIGIFATTAFAYVEGDVNAEDETESGTETAESTTDNGTVTFRFDTSGFSDTVETTQVGTVTNTNGSPLNVRSGSGLDYEVIDQLQPGDTVEVIEEDGGWYKVTISEKTGYVSKDYLSVDTESAGTSDGISLVLDEDMLNMIFQLIAQGVSSGDVGNAALTPDGNLTLVDDIGSSAGSGKQFITAVTKTGNYFYLIIDRDDEGESTVHFLNQVDERDLLALMDEDEAAEYAAAMLEEVELVAEEPDTEEPDESADDAEVADEPDDSGQSTNLFPAAVLLLVLIGGGGTFLYQKMKQKKQAAQEKLDPDADYVRDDDFELPGDDSDDLAIPDDGGDDTDETGEDEFDDYTNDELV